MTPFSFDPVTAREVVGDGQARLIEERARKDADEQTFNLPAFGGATYWDGVMKEMCCVLYREQHKKRTERNKRKATA